MTQQLELTDRIDELSKILVPSLFEVYAIISRANVDAGTALASNVSTLLGEHGQRSQGDFLRQFPGQHLEGDVFFETKAYSTRWWCPTLRPGDMVVLDNLSVHKVDGLEQVVKKYGARLLYLPLYSPDFNPIELAFSKFKTWLRKAQARTRDVLEKAILMAAERLSEHDAKNWFDHCGYHVH